MPKVVESAYDKGETSSEWRKPVRPALDLGDVAALDPKLLATAVEAARVELARRKAVEARRDYVLSGTPHFAEISGANVLSVEQGIYPWLPYAMKAAEYLDRPIRNISVPIKPVFIARLHLKTTIAGEALARFALANPEKRNCIFSWDAKKAEENLSQISNDFQSEEFQELFPDRLYRVDNNSRYYYKAASVLIKRKGNYKEPTVMALGAKSNRTGKHFNGVIWIDDVVTEDNYRNPDVQKQIWDMIQYIVNCIAEPGCQIWISGTRYAFHDAYGYLLKPDSSLKASIVPGYPDWGCISTDSNGRRKSLFNWKYCVTAEEKDLPVKYKKKLHYPVRSSLDEMRAGMDPILWAAQFENSPIIGGKMTFNPHDLDNIVPCNGQELDTFLRDQGGLVDADHPDRGPLDIVVPGDPAYMDKTHNDDSVLLTIGQDMFDYWYVMEARVTHDGWRGLESFLKEAYRWKRRYNARELAIEAHAKEALRSLALKIEAEMGVTAWWNPLKENSGGRNGPRKNERIATSLEDLIRGGRLWFCIPDDAGPNHPIEIFRQKLKTQAAQFPSALHDDCLDCLSNCRQSFHMRCGKKPKKVDLFPSRSKLPWRVRKWCVA